MIALASALEALIGQVIRLPEFAHLAQVYEEARAQSLALAAGGFDQRDLSDLARSVPDPFGRNGNPRWDPPLERAEDGRLFEPAWFVSLESRLQPALEAAATLRTLGYY